MKITIAGLMSSVTDAAAKQRATEFFDSEVETGSSPIQAFLKSSVVAAGGGLKNTGFLFKKVGSLKGKLTVDLGQIFKQPLTPVTWLFAVQSLLELCEKNKGNINELEIIIPYGLTQDTTDKLSRVLEHFFKHLPKGLNKVYIQCPANQTELSPGAASAILKQATADKHIILDNLKIADAQLSAYNRGHVSETAPLNGRKSGLEIRSTRDSGNYAELLDQSSDPRLPTFSN